MTFKLWRFGVGFMIPILIGGGIASYDSDEKLMTRVVYSETATQSQAEREGVARTILNRVESPDYPGDVDGVVYGKNAFACIGSKNWWKSKFARFRNDYEERVYLECRRAVRSVLENERVGVLVNDYVAFYSGDVRPRGSYWDSLSRGERINGGMTFCSPRD